MMSAVTTPTAAISSEPQPTSTRTGRERPNETEERVSDCRRKASPTRCHNKRMTGVYTGCDKTALKREVPVDVNDRFTSSFLNGGDGPPHHVLRRSIELREKRIDLARANRADLQSQFRRVVQ